MNSDSQKSQVEAERDRLRKGIEALADAYDNRPHQTAQDVVTSLRALLADHPNEETDNDPIAITHEQDPSLDEDEMLIFTTIDPESINRKKEQ